MKRAIASLFRLGAGLAAGVLLTAGAARAAEPAAPSPALTPALKWWDGYLNSAQAVKLADGRTMNLFCIGSGAPVVVLDSGLGDGAWSWSGVQGAIAQKTRVCSFDRPGYGRSSPGPEPRDSRAIVADMAAMLKIAKVPGPYVLVGHSAGSFDVRLFAFTHPKDVAGVVLVDPSADNQMQRLAAAAPAIKAMQENAYGPMKACMVDPRPPEAEKTCRRNLPPGVTPQIDAFFAGEATRPSNYKAILGEFDAFGSIDSGELVAAREKAGPHPLGDKPLVILTAANQMAPGLSAEDTAAIHKVWIAMHDEMTGLSTKGVNRIVEGASHYVHRDKPQVFLDTVFEVVDAARR